MFVLYSRDASTATSESIRRSMTSWFSRIGGVCTGDYVLRKHTTQLLLGLITALADNYEDAYEEQGFWVRTTNTSQQLSSPP